MNIIFMMVWLEMILYGLLVYYGSAFCIDVLDKSFQIQLLVLTLKFVYNVWLSDDGDYIFTTDEQGNAYNCL